jgi:hypothetical protein
MLPPGLCSRASGGRPGSHWGARASGGRGGESLAGPKGTALRFRNGVGG